VDGQRSRGWLAFPEDIAVAAVERNEFLLSVVEDKACIIGSERTGSNGCIDLPEHPARIGVVGEYFAFCLVPAPVRVGPSRVCPDVSIFSSPIREERSGCIGYKECSAVGDDYLSGVVAAFVGQLGGSGCSVNRGNRCIDVKGYINAVAHCDEAA